MRTTLAAAAALFMATTAAGSAADLAPVYAKAPAAIYSWSGFYIGANIGGGMAWSQFDDPCFYCSAATPAGGFFTGGAQLGYNYQFGAGLIGIEADVNGNSAFKESVIGGANGNAMNVRNKADVSGTIRARAGLVVSNALLYVTGGAAWADVKQTGIDFINGESRNLGVPTGRTANASGVLWGGVIGAGVEYALSPNWTIGAEFLHTMYQDRAAELVEANGTNTCVSFNVSPSNCTIRSQLTTDAARLRINYKFAP